MLRFSLPIVLALTLLLTISASVTRAAPVAPPDVTDALPAQQAAVDDNDDSRVAVQLVVAGIAVGVVVVLGSAGYLLRKKLGLVAPPPDQGAEGHH